MVDILSLRSSGNGGSGRFGVDFGWRDSRPIGCCRMRLVVQVHWPWPRRGDISPSAGGGSAGRGAAAAGPS
jgi:hypothetical protein